MKTEFNYGGVIVIRMNSHFKNDRRIYLNSYNVEFIINFKRYKWK